MMQAQTPTTPASSVVPDLLSSRVRPFALVSDRPAINPDKLSLLVSKNLWVQGFDTDGSLRDQRVLRGCATLPPVSTQPQAKMQAGFEKTAVKGLWTWPFLWCR